MPLTDIDPNVPVTGRNSRSSNFSGSHKDARRQSASSRPDTSSVAPSVFSMLKTTTESGDIGSLCVPPSRLPKIPNGLTRRSSGNNLSRTSSHYSRDASVRSKVSNHSNTETSIHTIPGSWPHSQNPQPRHREPQYFSPEARSSERLEVPRSRARSVPDQFEEDHRSYSLTSSFLPQRTLNNQRSAASLRSHGPLTRPRSPYNYPTRLRRPGYRPVSPAFSDTQGPPYYRPHVSRPGPDARAYATSPMPPNVQPGYRYDNRNDFLPVPPLRFNHSAEDFERPFVTTGRPNQPMPFPSSHPYRVAPTSPLYMNPAMHNRPIQPFISTPSPLRDGHSRFVNAESDERTLSSSPPYVGFVQRVKNILEEKNSPEEVGRSLGLSSPKERPEFAQMADESYASSDVDRPTRDLTKGAVDSGAGMEAVSSPGFAVPDRSNDQSGDSSGEGSSMHANGSVDIERNSSTPDLNRVHEKATSEVDTTASSADSASPAINFSLRSAIQRATAPTISEASHSFTGSVDLPAKSVQEVANDLSKPQTHDRPFSFPQSLEQRTENLNLTRQSLPPPSELRARTPPSFPTMQKIRQSLRENSHSVSTIATQETDEHSPGVSDDMPKDSSLPVVENRISSATVQSIDEFIVTNPQLANASDIPTWASTSIAARKNSLPVSVEPNRSTLPAVNDGPPRASQVPLPVSNPPTRRSSARDSAARESVASVEVNSNAVSNTSEPGDLRLSAMKQFQFPLPDLTEDSQEDASTTNLRMLGSKHPMFRGGVYRGARHEMKAHNRGSAEPRASRSYLSRKLAGTHGIPSFDFSNNDLTTTLNRALGLRSSRSLEDMRHTRLRGVRNSALSLRALQTKDLVPKDRERYKSFFSEQEDSEEEPTPEVTDRTVPQELLIEIDRLSIPSVNGLTLRLSELLPIIKRCSSEPDITKGDEALNSTIEEIRELGSQPRLTSIDIKRASLISAMSTDPGFQHDTTKDCTSFIVDGSPSQTGMLRLMKELPPLPSDVMSPRPSVASGPPRSIPIPTTNIQTPALVVELEATAPIKVPMDSTTTTTAADKDMSVPSPKKFKLKRLSNRTLAGTPDARPWTKQANYPWSEDTTEMEIADPEGGRSSGSPALRSKFKLRTSRSTLDLQPDDSMRIARSMSPGPQLDGSLIPQTDLLPDMDTTQPRKHGPFGSIIQRMGLKPNIDKAGFPLDPHFFHPEDRATEPGDRYPTTGLTPPSGLNLDDTRSFFSDDSSEQQRPRTGPMLKRLTRMKQKRSASRAVSLGDAASELPRSVSGRRQDESVFGSSLHLDTTDPEVILMMYDQPPVGMSKMEFRAKKVVEKLRGLWFKSGKIIRGLGHAKKQAPNWHAGEARQLYDGR